MSNLDDKKLTDIAAGGDAHSTPDQGTTPAPEEGFKRPDGGGDSGGGGGGGTPIEDDPSSTTPGQG